MKKLIYICHPFRAKSSKEVQSNINKAIKYGRMALEMGKIPMIPHVNSAAIFGLRNDTFEANARVTDFDLEILRRCDGMWVCGDTMSEGMQKEMISCRKWDIPVRHVRIP